MGYGNDALVQSIDDATWESVGSMDRLNAAANWFADSTRLGANRQQTGEMTKVPTLGRGGDGGVQRV
jgi:hypothetical protein